ncbi:MAG TPA: hypothetical protein VMQ76_10845 [Terracidiphilus sp.]|nr:hypothetical protein [Terracidiphilus sp.]
MNPIDSLEKIIPARYVPYVMFVVLCLPYVGRAIAALRNDHGLMGVFRGIMWGDPKAPGAVKLADDRDTQQFVRQQTYQPPPSPLAPPKP